MPLHWDQISVRLTAAVRVRCEPGWRLAPEWSARLADFDLWFVFGGRGTMELDGRPIHLRPGIVFWCRPGHSYLAEQDLEDRLGVCAVHFELVTHDGVVCRTAQDVEQAGCGSLPPNAQDLHDVNYVDAVLRRVVELTRRDVAPDEQAVRTATTLFTGLLMDIDAQSAPVGTPALAGTAKHHRDLILGAAAAIAESPADAPSIDALARQAGYTPDHFTRLFRQHLGLTPRAFILRARIERARELLVESGLSINQIADALGYRDAFFFSRQFKEKTGVSPSEYRAQAAGSL